MPWKRFQGTNRTRAKWFSLASLSPCGRGCKAASGRHLNRTPMLCIGYGEAKAGEGWAHRFVALPHPARIRGACAWTARSADPSAHSRHPLPQGEREKGFEVYVRISI